MDKKNTMLLTVIAVATLLVAVVGATFAYFSVGGATTSTSTVTTKADAVGTVAVANTNALYLNLTADQMSEANATKVYYAQATDIASSTEKPAATTVATFTASEVANNDVKYTCTFDYAITTTGDDAALAVLSADSAYTLTAGTGVTLETTDYKLAGTSQSGTGSLVINDGGTATISAVASVTNTSNPQDGLAGKTVTTTFTVSNFACDTTTAS